MSTHDKLAQALRDILGSEDYFQIQHIAKQALAALGAEQAQGVAEDRQRLDDYATEINRLRNVIQAACIGGTDMMIERWKQLFPDAPVPTVRVEQIQEAPQALTPLTDAQIEKLREQTFSTSNPFCPCDSKTMRKAVWAAERAHGIGTKVGL